MDTVQKLLEGPWLTSVLERRIAHGTLLSDGMRSGHLQTWGTGSTVAVEVDDDTITYGCARLVEQDIVVVGGSST